MIEVNPNNKFEAIETNTVPRYRIVNLNSEPWEWELESLLEEVKIKIVTSKFKRFDNMSDLDLDGNSFLGDMKKVEEYMKEHYPDTEYEVYGLGVYDHSGCSFGLVKKPVGGWDTYMIGFVALPVKNKNSIYADPLKVGSLITDIYEGSIYELKVEDVTDTEDPDEYFTYYLHLSDNKELYDWVASMNEKYQMKEDADKVLQ